MASLRSKNASPSLRSCVGFPTAVLDGVRDRPPLARTLRPADNVTCPTRRRRARLGPYAPKERLVCAHGLKGRLRPAEGPPFYPAITRVTVQ